MKAEDLLYSSNYPLSEKRSWNSGVGFYERGEEGYPFDFEASPDVLSALGHPFFPSLAIISMQGEDEDRYAAWRLGLECALNGISFSTNYSARGVERVLCEGALEASGRINLLLPGGIENFLDNRKRLSRILLSDGCILSPFRTELPISWKNHLYNRSLLAHSSCALLLRMRRSEYDFAVEVLDNGGSLFLHRLALKDRYGRNLAMEGAPVIDSVVQILSAPVGYLHESAGGEFQFENYPPLSFLKLK